MPTFETQSGIKLEYRVLPADTRNRIEAAIRAEWESEKPTPPIQRLEVGPDEFLDKAHDKHPDYLAALNAFDQRVSQAIGERLTKLIQDFATLTPTDEAKVKEFREAFALAGVEFPEESDRYVWLWRIALAENDEAASYTGKCLGAGMSALVEAQRRAFRLSLETATNRISHAATGS